MYAWIWRRLPGSLPVKLLEVLVLLCGVLALLFFVVFPWVDSQLPSSDVTTGP